MHACRICDEPAYHEASPFCERCKRVRNRIDIRGPSDKLAWERALRQAWDPRGRVFRCFYTQVELLTDGSFQHPRYLTREHRRPRDESTVVACAKVINDLKGTADETTFKRRVVLLAGAYASAGELIGDDRELESLLHGGAHRSATAGDHRRACRSVPRRQLQPFRVRAPGTYVIPRPPRAIGPRSTAGLSCGRTGFAPSRRSRP